MQRLFPATVLAASILAPAAQAQQRLGAGPNLYSREKEASLGRELARQADSISTPLTNADALRLVQQMGARLAAQLPDAPFPYRFTLIQSASSTTSTQEPLALPGGYIYVPSSIFLGARDESEFAGILAHAMAHVAERHATRLATKGALGQMATTPLIFYGGFPGYALSQASATTTPAALLRFSGAYEEEADALAVKMTMGAGYEAAGLLHYLSHQPPETLPPGLPARIAALRGVTQAPTAPNDEFLRIQEQLRRN